MAGFHAGWLGPFLPRISRSLNVSIDLAGLAVSVSAAGGVLALLAAGEISRRWSARAVLTGAMVLIATGTLLLAMAPRLSIYLLGAFLLGPGYGAVDVAGNTLVVELNRDRLSGALNFLHLLFGLGALIGPIIAGVAMTHGVPYWFVFGGGATFAALIAAALYITPAPEIRVRAAGGDGLVTMLSHPFIWLVGAVLFFYVAAEAGIGTWLFVYLRRAGLFSVSLASGGVSMYWFGLVLGRAAGGIIGNRFAVRTVTMIAALLSLIAVVTLVMAPTTHTIAGVATMLIGLGYGPIFPNMIAIGAERFSTELERMSSIVIAGGAIGAIFGPWAMGYALVVAGPRASMEVALAITALMLMVAVVGLWSSDRPDQAANLLRA